MKNTKPQQISTAFSKTITNSPQLMLATPLHAQSQRLRRSFNPRWVSLTPYKQATSFFNEVEGEGRNPEIETADFGAELEEKVDLLEDATGKALTMLRCYRFNLHAGTLATGDKIDERVADVLRRILGLSLTGREASDQDQGMLERNGAATSQEMDEPSDEDRMVTELDGYAKLVDGAGGHLTSDVVEVAREILDRAAERKTVDLV